MEFHTTFAFSQMKVKLQEQGTPSRLSVAEKEHLMTGINLIHHINKGHVQLLFLSKA